MNESLLHSQLFIGGFALMLSGAVMALLRNMPTQLLDWLKYQFTVSLLVIDSDPLFESLVMWLDDQPYSKRTRRLIVSTIESGEERFIAFSPGVGTHFFKYKGSYVWLHRSREQSKSAPDSGLTNRRVPSVETILLTVFGRSQKLLRELLEDAQKSVVDRQRQKVAVYVADYGWWRKLRGTTKRPYESVHLPEKQSDELLQDVQWFLDNQSSYTQCSVPYRRGYLLEGLAGTGKTSMVVGLASELNLSLYVLPLSSPDMTDQTLNSLMLGVRPGSIILLEDVDAIGLKRSEPVQQVGGDQAAPSKSQGVTLSGVLNCLDGVAAQEGCIIFMTTNHVGQLDPALIRPGRVDVRVHFDYANPYQIVSAYKRFFPNANGDATEFVEKMPQDVVMAQVQEELMRLRFRSKLEVEGDK